MAPECLISPFQVSRYFSGAAPLSRKINSVESNFVIVTGFLFLPIAIEPWYEGSVAGALTRSLGHLAARYDFLGVPRRFIHDYGTWAEIDADLGLDAAGLQARIRPLVGAG